MSFHPNSVARRGRIASIALLALFGLLVGRFFLMQVLRHTQYALQSEQNRLNEVPLPAPRGIIYDRNGLIIAENIPGYTVSILEPRVDSLKAFLGRLATRIPLTRGESLAAIRRHGHSRNRPTVILPDAPFATVSVLEEHRTEFPGLIIQSAPKRFYADRDALSAFIGYTSEINEAELADTTRLGYKQGQQIGKAGLEAQYESLLRGTEGSRFVEVDARNRVVRDVGVRAELRPVAGQSLHTNIDLPLQRHVAKVFGDSLMGAAVVLDPRTGGVLAIHSAPGYDPNAFIGGISFDAFRALNEDTLRRPLHNKAVQGAYEPGSTWKLATALIGLQQKKVTIHEKMPQGCTGGYQLGNRRFRCWERNGHGSLDLKGAIRLSCDVYFYQLGLRISFDTLVAGGRRLGFGERTGIDLPSEGRNDFPPAPSLKSARYRDSLVRAGVSRVAIDSLMRVAGDSLIDVIAYYDRKFGRNWTPESETLNLSIGQGSNASTVISMARFYTALANHGIMSKPKVVGDSVEQTRIFTVSDSDMAELVDAMASVVETGGTAASAGIRGVRFAGKTGTAQHPRDRVRDHAWFVGFAPAEEPKVVVAVFLEFGLHGYLAARVAKSIVEFHLKTTVSDIQRAGD